MRVEGHTRAAFLLRATLAVGAAGAASPRLTRALAQGGDTGVLQYLLALEHLEAGFYAQALREVPRMSADVRALVEEVEANEREHVTMLEAAIERAGATPAPRPRVRFGASFADEATFLRVANVLEDTGVSAYNGAAPRLVSRAALGSAGAIVQVEARHAALIRLERGKPPAPRSFDVASGQDAVERAIAPFRTP